MFKSKIISYTILFTSLFTILSGYSGASIDPFFRSTWRVPEGDKSITLPLVGDYNYNFTVDWGDGETSRVTSHNDPDRTHTYMAAGDYNLVIKGILEAWSFNSSGDKDKIISVEDFGDLGYKNLSRAFFGCTNLGVFEGGVTSDVTNMASMFDGATQANPNVSEWDVSSVTNMASMFDGATQANPNVSEWDVSSVTNMFSMFGGATQANPNVTKWDVSSVTSMDYMFYGAIQANPSVTKWDVSSVTNMASMFDGATQANPNVSEWDVSSVTNMFSMFGGATQANPNVTKWDVSSVTSMDYMFYGATQANPNVTKWDVSSVINMASMFYGATQANPNVSEWDVSSVTNMYNMYNMFHGSGLTTANYDALLINLADNNASVEGMVLGALGVQYSSGDAKTARDTLESRGWIITDDGDATP